MILIYHLKSLTDEYSIILASWPFGEPLPLTWPFVAFWLTPPPPLLATWFLDAPLHETKSFLVVSVKNIQKFCFQGNTRDVHAALHTWLEPAL